jgi:hypothetical protein
MINRKELRIGNYITRVTASDGFYASVVSIGVYTCIYGVGYTAFFDKLSPIPLTEKWLLDFGFEKGDYGFYKLYYNDDFYLLTNLKGYTELCINKIKGAVVETKHVHQLQNLYFALTGEELTLKLK